EEACHRLYGEPWVDEIPVPVYIASSSKGSRSAAGIFWGKDSAKNEGLLMEGSGDKVTLAAIVSVCAVTDKRRNLVIYMANTSLIRTLCYGIGKHAAMGWSGVGDKMLELAAKSLRGRLARSEF
ncbi:hypothetical protein C8J56DRAFT_720551, partial [Mycena floridula]